MEDSIRKFLTESYLWNSDANYVVLHSGENHTYIVETEFGKFALRRYRPGRHTLDRVRAEIAWINKLSEFIRVPRIIENRFGHPVSILDDDQGDIYVVSEFIEGDVILHPTASDYRELGRLMRALHISSDHILKNAAKDWEGWDRPTYTMKYIVDESLRHLLDFDPLPSNDKERCIRIAQYLTDACIYVDCDPKFIHADLHFGNLLSTASGFCYLDFDECGFGHRSIDIGVVRLHIHRTENPAGCWVGFQEGYGTELADEETRLGAALRIFYLAGKIPRRQDIEELRLKSADYIRRYLGYIESEIRSS